MTNQNKRPVSTLLCIGIFLVPGIFSWFTLRAGYSALARIVTFSWLAVSLYVAFISPVFKNLQQESAMLLGFFPEHIKAQKCLKVSYFLPESEAAIWRDASNKRIQYWLTHQSGCLDHIDCFEREAASSNFVTQRLTSDGSSINQDMLKKWMNSEYCQTLVATHRYTLSSNRPTTPLSSNRPTTPQTAEPVTSSPFQIILNFKERGGGSRVLEAAGFQNNKGANFCYDTEELNSIMLKGTSIRNASLVISGDAGIFFEQHNIHINHINTSAIFYNSDIKIEPGPVRFQIEVIQDGELMFQGLVDSHGCS